MKVPYLISATARSTVAAETSFHGDAAPHQSWQTHWIFAGVQSFPNMLRIMQ
jgi:hypothetical protein